MSNTRAYEQGWDAYYDGMDLDDNPYLGTDSADEWTQGFEDARELEEEN